MDVLSPAKLLVILVVALAVLGPDKLPTVAKQVGSLWSDFKRFRQKLETDVRGSFPDLPSTETITKAVRAPLSFLDTLADAPRADGTAPTAEPASGAAAPRPDEAATHRPDEPAPIEFDPSAGAHWPTGTVIASEGPSPEPPVLVAPAGSIVHEVRSGGGGHLPDPGSN